MRASNIHKNPIIASTETKEMKTCIVNKSTKIVKIMINIEELVTLFMHP
jgi:hypothetical protein